MHSICHTALNWSAMFGFLGAVCLFVSSSWYDVRKLAKAEGPYERKTKAERWMIAYFVGFVLFGAGCFLMWGR